MLPKALKLHCFSDVIMMILVLSSFCVVTALAPHFPYSFFQEFVATCVSDFNYKDIIYADQVLEKV